MKIIFMGSPDFAVPCLEALINDGNEIAAVFTQPDKPRGRRGSSLVPTPVKECAVSHGIAVYQPLTLRDGEAMDVIRAAEPEMIVVAAYGRILPKEIIDYPKYGCVNAHASLLPEYRGAAPIQRAVMEGKTKTGVTAQLMNEGLDTGDILMKTELEIGENETSDELHDRLAQAGAELIVKVVHAAEEGTLRPEKQDDSRSTYAAKLTKEMFRIDFAKPASEVHNTIRGLNPSNTMLAGKRIKVYHTRLAQGSGEPGHAVSLSPFVIACGEGAIEIIDVQPEGKKVMSAQAFLNGLRVNSPEEIVFE